MKWLLLLMVALAFASARAFSSVQFDNYFSLKVFAPLMVNFEKEPVYAEHVETSIMAYLRTLSRFEPSESGLAFLKKKLSGKLNVEIGTPTPDKLLYLSPIFKELAAQGTSAAIVTEVQSQPESYKLLFTLVTVPNGDIVHHVTANVDNRFSLDSFGSATQSGLGELFRGIPFHGTILRREGYRVVIDRGAPDLQEGMQISTYTVESKEGKPSLEETGTLVITQAESRLSFGKITVEKKPAEVTAGNKILLPEIPIYADLNLLPPPFDKTDRLAFRQPASMSPVRRLGHVDVNLGASVVNLTNVAADGSSVTTGDALFPGGGLKTELWMSRRVFFDFGIQFGMKSVQTTGGTTNQNSNISDIRGQIGYRIGLSDEDYAPKLYIKVGFGREQFQIDPSSNEKTLVTTTYSGFLMGGGAKFPLTELLELGFEVNGLIFPSVEESPFLSGGEIRAASAWDFTLGGSYELYPQMDLDCRMQFQASGADFSGKGTRGATIVTTSQSSRALIVGLSYYF